MPGFVRGSPQSGPHPEPFPGASKVFMHLDCVFRRISVRNSKSHLPFHLPVRDVTSEGQGRGDAVTSPPWGMSENAVQMDKNLTGTRECSWVRPRLRRPAHKIALEFTMGAPGPATAIEPGFRRLSNTRPVHALIIATRGLGCPCRARGRGGDGGRACAPFSGRCLGLRRRAS